jgi:arabinofuranan 3-O-arabinosyltransferase
MALTRSVWRLRLLATCLALTALAFLQDPGLTAADTKLDLTANPWGFLGRALHLWDAQGFFGQLQNQAYGYFFPMGPFFGVLTSAGVPAWVAQRLWWSLLLCVGFLGMVRLARLLGIRRPAARWLAALAYVLAPRAVSTLGPISSETLAVMVAPWVLVPLVSVTRAGSRASVRRSAGLSALAVLCAGGINAVATGAVLVLPFLWLLTRPAGPLRRRLTVWWAGMVLLAISWWLIPLVTLGRYSPPFLDWIESASITTGRSDIGAATRGTTDWVAYVGGASGPTWPAGWQLVATWWLVLLAGLVAAVGLTGVALSRRHRGFLVVSVLVGLALLTLGHTGPVQGAGASALQDVLDGALAPLRNTHKFDLVLRVPLALGVGLATGAIADARRRVTALTVDVVLRRAALPLTAVLLLLLAYPAVSGGITRGRSYQEIPQYWRDAAAWLGDHGQGRSLVVPGASFGTYLWGRPQDEPLQPLATTPWGIRDAVPLSSAGNIRLLDSVEARLETGRGSAGLSEALARAGVRFLVVRNDLDTVGAQAPRSVLVHQALDQSPGIRLVTTFGPAIVPFGTESLVVDSRLDAAYNAVEVYSVSSPDEPGDGRVVVRDGRGVISDPSTTSDAVVDLADAGLLQGRSAVLGSEVPTGLTATSVLVDSFRRTEVEFGAMRDNRSAVMTATQAWTARRKVHDFPGGTSSAPATVAPEGVRSITASSSQSGLGNVDGIVPGASPYAAVDLDLATAWQVRDVDTAKPSWWKAEFLAPRSVSGLQLALRSDPVTGARPTQVTVVTDTGSVTTALRPTDDVQPVGAPAGDTNTLTLELPAPSPSAGARVTGLREVVVPGLLVGRPLVVPATPAGGGIVLTARAGARDGCVSVPLRFPCGSALPRAGEDDTAIDRVIEVPEGAAYDLSVGVRLRAADTAGRLLDPARAAVRASASSTLVGDPRARPQAAVDRDPSTAWIAGVGDPRPTLTLTLPAPRTITGVVLQTGADVAASRPLSLSVEAGGRTFTSVVDGNGVATLPQTRTDVVRITFTGSSPLRSLDPQRGITTQLPVGVSEVFLRGALDLGQGVARDTPAGLACGFGPVLQVDGGAVSQTGLRTTVGGLLTGRTASARGCSGTIRLAPGTHRVRVASTPELAVTDVVLSPSPTSSAPAAAYEPAVTQWASTERSVVVTPAAYARTLELGENANAGWVATLDGAPLASLTVDGWRQAFVLPPEAGGEVRLAFAADRTYRWGLVVGACGVLLLLALTLLPSRRRTDADERAVPRRGMVAALVARLPWPPRVVTAAGVTVAAVVVGGVWGLGAAAVVGLALARARHRARWVAVLGVLAAVAAATVPWPASLETPIPGAVASALSLVAVVAACWPWSPPLGDQPPEA